MRNIIATGLARHIAAKVVDPKCSIYFVYVLAIKVINHGSIYLAKIINKSIKLCFGSLHLFFFKYSKD